jgi:sporulation protein YlmC with PRC-barrel domain
MYTRKLALAALATALLSATAIAQSSPPPASSQPAATSKPMDQKSVQSTAQGKWRASKLIGLNVYNANNEKIGDINELVTDSSGKIDIVVIGVGGFLGMGEHRVGIPFAQVKWVDEPVRSSSTTTTSSAPRTTGAGTTATTATRTTTEAKKDYPDHAMVNMTKDQLKALPAFKYASDTSSSSTRTTSPAPASPPAKAPANPPANTSK